MAYRVVSGRTKVRKVINLSRTTALSKIVVSGANTSHKALNLTTGKSITAKVVSSPTDTVVKQIKVGTPVRRVSSGDLVDVNTLRLEDLLDVNSAPKEDGSVLVYELSSTKWTATRLLEKQDITGGQY